MTSCIFLAVVTTVCLVLTQPTPATTFGEYICTFYPPPQNGALACDNWLGGRFCRVSCNDEFDFNRQPEELYYCRTPPGGDAGEWGPSPLSLNTVGFKMPWPDCTEMRDPSVEVGLELNFFTGDCLANKDEIKRDFLQKFQQFGMVIPGLCVESRGCVLENVEVSCGPRTPQPGGSFAPKTCPILVAEMQMRIIPPDCMERQLDYKSQCFYECDCGFQLIGVGSRTCQEDGTWSDPLVQNTCIDIEPPEFITCPGDISLPTDLHQNFTTNPANWDQPQARDNDGEPVIEASPSATQQRFYLDEVTVIAYTARDEAGLENTCNFSIAVKDEEPPQVIHCPNSIAVKTDTRLAVVHWEEPVFQDNSGHDVSVIFNRPSGSSFFFGQPESIWYIAEDQAGNTARCEFTVSEEDLEPPEFITCPDDIVLPTDLHENFTTTTWDQPEARDNIGRPTVEASPSAAKERFYLDEVTVVTYTARDRAGLESTCTFSITVRDEEPPQVVGCPGSVAVETRGSSENVHWEEPVFQDNSGKEVTVVSDFPSGFKFYCGLLETVQYIAEDQAGNTVICEFTVNVICMK